MKGTWIISQTWADLLFAHWPVPVERIQPFVPPPLEVDTFDGMAWIGLIPFEMSEIPLRFLPVPVTVPFPEINVRTYVILGGKPAVFFLSLDASNQLAVGAAKLTYHLPYFHAKMSIKRTAAEIHFQSERKGGEQRFSAIYRPASEPFTARPGSIEHWLTERYRFCCLCPRTQRIYGGDICHEPWRLQAAEAVIRENTMGDQYGIDMSKAPVHLLYAQGVVARIWRARKMFGA